MSEIDSYMKTALTDESYFYLFDLEDKGRGNYLKSFRPAPKNQQKRKTQYASTNQHLKTFASQSKATSIVTVEDANKRSRISSPTITYAECCQLGNEEDLEERQNMKQAILNAKKVESENMATSSSNTGNTVNTTKSTISTMTMSSMQQMEAVEAQMNQLEFSTRAHLERSATAFQTLSRAQMNMHNQQKLHSAVMGVLAQGINDIATQTHTTLNPQTLSITQGLAQGKFLLSQQDGMKLIEHYSSQQLPNPPNLPPIDMGNIGTYVQDSELFFSPVNSQDHHHQESQNNAQGTNHIQETIAVPNLEEVDRDGNVIQVSSEGLEETNPNGEVIPISSSQEYQLLSTTAQSINNSAQQEPEALDVQEIPLTNNGQNHPPLGGAANP